MKTKKTWLMMMACMLCFFQMQSLGSVAFGADIVQTWDLTPTMSATLDSEGVLIISTTLDAEAMPDYPYEGAPWNSARNNILSVVIEDKVINISDNAFYNCKYLTSVMIPNSVTSIGVNAFYTCSSLCTILIPSSVTSIGVNFFFACSSLSAINVENGNLNYSSDEGVFYNKEQTILYKYPSGKSGSSFSIPNSVISINDGAFYECSNLTSIAIPASVTDISQFNPFDFCTNLSAIIVDLNNSNYYSEEGVLYSKDKTALCVYPIGKTGSSFSISNSVISIRYAAFIRCSNLSSIIIPNSVTNIDAFAFFECNNMNEVTTEWTTPLSVSSNIFIGVNISTTTLHVPVGAKSLYEAAEVWKDFGTIVEDVISEGWQVWNLTPTMTAILSTDGVLTISTTLAAEVMPDYPYDGQFNDIPWYNYRNDIKSVVIQPGITNIGDCAFINGSVTSVNIPNTVTRIGDYAFAYFPSNTLNSIDIPNSVTSIGNNAFDASGLTGTIHIPGSVTSIGGEAFYQNFSLTDINVAVENLYYNSIDGILYDETYETLIFCPNGKTDAIVIPNSVTKIGASAFNKCHSIAEVIIPESVKIIGENAFFDCQILTSITIPESVTVIGRSAFSACHSLTEINVNANNSYYSSIDGILYNKSQDTLIMCPGGKSGDLILPDKVTTIDEYAFFGCLEITAITLPVNLTRIEYCAFNGCYNIATVTNLNSTPPSIDNMAFTWIDLSAKTLYVPSGSLAAYQAAEVWKDFGTIVEQSVPVTGVSLNQTTVALYIDDTAQLTATVSPSDATNKNVTWSSSNLSVATVSNTGLITAAGEGTTTITVTTEDGGFSASCVVTVSALTTEIAVTGVSLDQNAISMWVGENQPLTATVSPVDATNRNVIWSSSNPAIATVSDAGLINAISKGSATITVTTEEGEFTASCAVEVLQQEVVVPDNTQTGADGKGKIVLSLTIPADVLFSGSFRLTLPNGVQLDLSVTNLTGDLASQLKLTIVQEADGSWIFTITPQTLRSATEMVYSQILEIGYTIDETVEKGEYEAAINDLLFTFDNGTVISEDEIPVNIKVDTPTGISDLTAETNAYLYDGQLFVNSPVAETIRVYSLSGVALYNFQKPAGKASYLIDKRYGSVLIVKGSSGWVKKI